VLRHIQHHGRWLLLLETQVSIEGLNHPQYRRCLFSAYEEMLTYCTVTTCTVLTLPAVQNPGAGSEDIFILRLEQGELVAL
jgi:hypothetical protein